MLRRLQDETTSEQNIELAFGLTIGAGLCTSIGAAIVYWKRFTLFASPSMLAMALAFSSGVMIYVSFVEIFKKSQDAFVNAGIEDGYAALYTTICFFGGIGMVSVLDLIVHALEKRHTPSGLPANVSLQRALQQAQQHERRKQRDPEAYQMRYPYQENENETSVISIELTSPECSPSSQSNVIDTESHMKQTHQFTQSVTSDVDALDNNNTNKSLDHVSHEKSVDTIVNRQQLNRMGMLTALAIGLHNFPEGLATFVGALSNSSAGIPLAIAIGIHNIPEGICVAVPIFYATGNRTKAFLWGTLSGITEPIGALLGWLVLQNILNDIAYGVVFGLVAGMMVQVCFHELLPAARRYDINDKFVNKSLVAGMAIMAFSLVLFNL